MQANIDVVHECNEALQDPFREPDYEQVVSRLEDYLRAGREIDRKHLLAQSLSETSNHRAVNALIVAYVRWRAELQKKIDTLNQEVSAANALAFQAGKTSAEAGAAASAKIIEFRKLTEQLSSLPKL